MSDVRNVRKNVRIVRLKITFFFIQWRERASIHKPIYFKRAFKIFRDMKFWLLALILSLSENHVIVHFPLSISEIHNYGSVLVL